ncbi:hypothetical protein QC761_608335 [Podospora bellae-mahoneyi]|uniref:Glycerophosphocholine acyltransferase 1 n=1 Tax=Podospora bellae-mahoneyi TaxID=2093777 RepID=A0ABR0FAI4_9PEZI|nr:hypothetical protein QC761_608335 [Podospora bellae-mahoneyi]
MTPTSSPRATPLIPEEDILSKVLLRHSNGASTFIVPWWRLEKRKDGMLVRQYADAKSEVLTADFKVARMCLLEYLDSIQFYMNRLFIEIDKAVAKKQEEFDDGQRKKLLHLVRVAFYNILVMSLWTLSFHLLTTHFHFYVTPVIYAFLYFVAHDLLGASWKTLWATIFTIASKDSPLQRELTHL